MMRRADKAESLKAKGLNAESAPLKIALVACEASGDLQGAALLTALRARAQPRSVIAWGLGGSQMESAGVTLRRNSVRHAGIGIVSVAASLPTALSALADMKRCLAQDPPDALVLIDAGGFNVRLAQWVKQHRLCPIFYYFPPGSWRRKARPEAVQRLAAMTDRIVTPFPWSETALRQGGADAHFVGHPLLDMVQPTLADTEFYARFGLDPHRPLVALLPGSRRMEIAHILPALIGAAGEIARRIPSVQFALALARSVPRSLVEETIRREQKRGGRAARLQLLMHQAGGKLVQIAQTAQTNLTPAPRLATNEGLTLPPPADEDLPLTRPAPPAFAPLVICEDLTYDVMARSDLVITKSGTSTLEAAILQKPMIIVYRGSALMNAEWQLRKRFLNVAHIGLPNILAEERLFPELLQEEATPEKIAELALEVLLQPELLLHLKQKLADLIQATLGQPGGIRRAAELLYETATTPQKKL